MPKNFSTYGDIDLMSCKWVWEILVIFFIIYLIDFDHIIMFQKLLLSSSSSSDGKIFMKFLSLVLVEFFFKMTFFFLQFCSNRIPKPTITITIAHPNLQLYSPPQTLNIKLKTTHKFVPWCGVHIILPILCINYTTF